MLSRMSLLLAAIALLGTGAFGQAPTCGIKCGQERWAIKTLTDNDAATVGTAVPQDTTVTTLIGETAPAKLTDTRVPLEKQRVHLTALIIGWKIETAAENFAKKASESTSVPDHDFHIVIADPNNTNNQMIMEVPDPECEAVCSSKFLAQISQVRKEVSSRLGTPHSTKPEPIQMLKTLFAPGMILMRFSFWGGHPSKARNAGTSQFLKRILSAQCFQENPANKRRRHCSYTVPIL